MIGKGKRAHPPPPQHEGDTGTLPFNAASLTKRADYDTDFVAWATEQAALLRSGRLAELASGALLPYFRLMLAKLTAKNQLTLPRQAVQAAGNPSHFEVEVDGLVFREVVSAVAIEGGIADNVGL